MGCICSKQSLQDVDQHQAPDIRARYSVDTFRPHADLSSNVFVGQEGHHRPPHLAGSHPSPAAVTVRRTRSSSSTSSATGLSRSQWKQVRTLVRSNTNPHYHQIPQLQVLPGSQQQQQHAAASQLRNAFAAAAAAGPTSHGSGQPHHHHHQHHHHQFLSHPGIVGITTLSPVQLADISPAVTPGPGVSRSITAVPAGSGHSLGHSAAWHVSSKSGSAGAAAAVPTTAADALTPEQVLAVCGALVEEEPALAAAGIHPLLLASLCIIESAGCPTARQYRDHLGDMALGLCQMLLSTAQWLASSKGFDRYGANPTAADLEQPKVCLYYCAAYLLNLAQHDGCQRSERFIVKAYHVGPKGIDAAAAGLYWQKYLKAKHCLTEVVRCMAVTVAAAAAAAGLPLKLPAAATTGAACEDGGPDGRKHASCGPISQQQHSSMSPSKHRTSRATSPSQDSSSCQPHGSMQQQQEVLVWGRAAKLVAALADRWEPGDAAAAANAGQGAAEGVLGSSGSFIAHIIPNWREKQPQQQQDMLSATSSGSGSTLLRRWRSNSSNVSTGALAAVASSSRTHSASSHSAAAAAAREDAGVLALVPVKRTMLDAALLRMSCIDCTTTATALGNAAVAAVVAVATAGDLQRRSSPAAGAHSSATKRGAAAAATAASAAAKHARSSSNSLEGILADMPCVMHVVGHGESLAQIATICGVAVPEVLAANPDLPDGSTVQANDCIALPLPAIPPRLHVVQYGETVQSIAKAQKVPLGRLLAKNPELANPSRVQPGWVVVLPGLKGDSKSGAGIEWLAEAAVATAGEELAAMLDDEAIKFQEAGLHITNRVSNSVSNGASDSDLASWQRDARRQQQGSRADQDAAAVTAALNQETAAAAAAAEGNNALAEDDLAPAAEAVEGAGTSPCATWAHVGWRSKTHAPMAAAAAAAQPAVTAAPLPTLGSGVFLFSVGQSISAAGSSNHSGNNRVPSSAIAPAAAHAAWQHGAGGDKWQSNPSWAARHSLQATGSVARNSTCR